jgi:pyruvate, orthophosphate dikinase
MTYVYDLGYRHDLPPEEVTALVGGKAANLAVMAGELDLPVPAGFVISTAACRAFLASGWPPGLDAEVQAQMRALEEKVGRRFGGRTDPLLVSVRSGAPVSMPGMMDTILNLGLNAEGVQALTSVYGSHEFAEDCYRSLAQMFSDVVGARAVPEDPWQQLRAAIEGVFQSWDGDRARAYRKHEGIPDDLGTAVTVQAMVFGNLGPRSCTGVLFSRNPSTGDPKLYGDVVFGAQGDAVVAGTHKTEDVAVLDSRLPVAAQELWRSARALERHFGDLCEIEFTIERAKLWFLQVRRGKCTPQAALRIARDMAEDPDFPLSRAEAVSRVAQYLVHPPLVSRGPVDDNTALARGLPASPGIASGQIVTSPEEAESVAATGRPLVLVRVDTSPEDVPSMALAAGVITARGGLTSHAAVIARDWGIPAVVSAPVCLAGEKVIIGERTLAPGDIITIDGHTGDIFAGWLKGSSVVSPEAEVMVAWAQDEGIELGHRVVEKTTEPSTMEPTAADVIRALALKEVATVDALASAVFSTREKMELLTDELARDGLVKTGTASISLTDAGKARVRGFTTADRNDWGAENAVAALDAFLKFDIEVKETVTAWQLRSVDGLNVPNDHTDAAYDALVLARLTALHGQVAQWLEPLSDKFDRLALYAARLGRALASALGGDQGFIASARVDSYHIVWFELHEELIRLAGSTREKEVEAGRA